MKRQRAARTPSSNRQIRSKRPHETDTVPAASLSAQTGTSIKRLRSIFFNAGCVWDSGRLTASGLDELTREEMEDARIQGIYSESVMASFIKILQDSILPNKWIDLPESAARGMPLCQSIGDLKCLAQNFNIHESPVTILKRTAYYYQYDFNMMKIVGRTLPISEQVSNARSEGFRHTPSHFFAILPLQRASIDSDYPQTAPATVVSKSVNDHRPEDDKIWVFTVCSPENGRIIVVGRPQDRVAWNESSRNHLRESLAVLWKYWNLAPDQEPEWLDGQATGLSSAVFCVLLLFLRLCEETGTRFEPILDTNSKLLQSCLYYVLSHACGNRE